MLKFKFNYLNQTLAYQKPFSEPWYPVTETFEGNFGSLGFQLTDGWITFTVYSNRIRVFYKQIQAPLDPSDYWETQPVYYFRKDLPKKELVIFEFSARDQVEKVGNSWVKKGESKM